VPKKTDAKGWKNLRLWCNERQREATARESCNTARRRHDIEKRILSLRSRPQSPARDKLIKRLEKELQDA
jgi:hypothetical protein